MANNQVGDQANTFVSFIIIFINRSGIKIEEAPNDSQPIKYFVLFSNPFEGSAYFRWTLINSKVLHFHACSGRKVNEPISRNQCIRVNCSRSVNNIHETKPLVISNDIYQSLRAKYSMYDYKYAKQWLKVIILLISDSNCNLINTTWSSIIENFTDPSYLDTHFHLSKRSD